MMAVFDKRPMDRNEGIGNWSRNENTSVQLSNWWISIREEGGSEQIDWYRYLRYLLKRFTRKGTTDCFTLATITSYNDAGDHINAVTPLFPAPLSYRCLILYTIVLATLNEDVLPRFPRLPHSSRRQMFEVMIVALWSFPREVGAGPLQFSHEFFHVGDRILPEHRRLSVWCGKKVQEKRPCRRTGNLTRAVSPLSRTIWTEHGVHI